MPHICFLLLIAHESYVPRTTTKICRKCSYLTPTRPTYLTERNKMCAISDKIDKYNTSCDMFDACLGDSGGNIVDVYCMNLLPIFIRIYYDN